MTSRVAKFIGEDKMETELVVVDPIEAKKKGIVAKYYKVVNVKEKLVDDLFPLFEFNTEIRNSSERIGVVLRDGISSFVQRPVLRNLADLRSLAEIRNVTTVFIDLIISDDSTSGKIDLDNLYAAEDQVAKSIRMATQGNYS